MIRFQLPKPQIIFVLWRHAEKVFAPLHKAKKASIWCGSSQIKFYNKQISKPADHTLHNFNGVGSHDLIRQKQFIRQIHMNKCQSHGVTAHHPATMDNIVLVDSRRVSEISDTKPNNSHWRKAKSGNSAGIVIPRQGQNGYRTYQTSDYINLSHANMPFWVVFPKLWRKQKRTNDNRKGRGKNVPKQKLVIDNGKVFGKVRRQMLVLKKHVIKNIMKWHMNDTYREDHKKPGRQVKIADPNINNAI